MDDQALLEVYAAWRLISLPSATSELLDLRDELAYYDLIVFTHIDLDEGTLVANRPISGEVLIALRSLQRRILIEKDGLTGERERNIGLYVIYASIIITIVENTILTSYD